MSANILTYLNYGLLGATIAIIVILVFFFFRGLMRGWRYGTYRVIIFAIFFAIAFASLKQLSTVMANVNLASFNLPDFSVTFSVGEDPVTLNVHFTTFAETVSDVLQQLFKAYNIKADPQQLAAYSTALAYSIAALLLMMVESLIICTLGNLLSAVLWHLLVKRFIKREKRKAKLKKGKLISAFEELVIATVCLAMFISPLTSMVNTMVASLKTKEEEGSSKTVQADNSTAQLINDVVDTYENSLFSQVFFSWTKNEEGKTFDVAFTEYVSTMEFGETSVSFLNELTSLTKTASCAIQGGLLSEQGFQKQNVGAFISSEFAPQLIRSLGSSRLFTTVFPYAVAVATNMDQVAKYIQTDEGLDIDYTYDYAKTFDQLADLYEVVVESGIISEVLNEDLSLKPTDEILTTEFVTENRGVLSTILTALDDESLHLFDSIVEAAVFVYCANEAKNEKENPEEYKTKIMVKDFMPNFEETDADNNGIPDRVPSSYRDIKWGEALCDIVDPIIDLMTIDPKVINMVLSATQGGEFDYNELIGITVDNYDAVVSVICGEEPSTDSEVKSARQSTKGLLESPFVQNGMGKLLNILASQLNSMLNVSGDFEIDLSGVVEKLTDKDAEKQTKKIVAEFKCMFDVVGEFLTSDAGSNFLKNLDTMPGIYFDEKGGFLGVDDDLLASLSSALIKLDNSLIVEEVMPKALGSFLTGEKSPISSMNIGDIHFDFDVDNIGTELSELVTQFSKSQDLVSYLLSVGTISTSDPAKAASALSGLVKYSDQLLDFLLFVADSKIINPTVDGKQNYNIAEILKSLLSSLFDDAEATINDVVFSTDFDIDTELTSVVNLLVDLDRFNVVEIALGLDKSNINLGSFASIDFAQLFSNIDGSKIMSKLMGNYLDEILFKDGGAIYVEGVDVSFSNISSWSAEGNTINTLVRAVNEIGDLSNIDFFNSDPYAIESIIKSLSQSSLFDAESGYQFSKYLSGLLIDNIEKMGSDASKLFGDKEGTGYAELEYAITHVSKEEWIDEGYSLSQIIKYLSPCKDMLSGGNINLKEINLTAIESLMDIVTESKAFGSTLIPNLYNLVIDTIADSGMDAFNNANKDYIYTANKDDIRYENRQLIKILQAAADPVYGIVADDGSVKSISISDVDAYYLVNPLLKALAGSHVFNSLSDGQIAAGVTMTALEKEFATLLGSASLFENQTSADKAVLSVTKGVTEFRNRVNAWSDEIDNVTEVLTSIQSLDIDLDHFSLDGIFGSGKDETKRQKLENLLLSINDSQILHSVLPYQIDKSIDSLSSGFGSSITLENVNAYYTGFDEDGLANKYDDEEIVNLSHIIQEGYTMGNIDIKAMDSGKIDDLTSLLQRLASSNVFNTISNQTSEYQMTALEGLYYSAVNGTGVFTDSNQLKATVFQVTSGARSDLSVLGTRPASWGDEIDLLHQAFLDFDAMGLDFGSFDFNSITSSQEGQLADLLDNIDKSTTLHIAIPTRIQDAVNDVDNSLGEGVSLGTINSEYKGTTSLPYGDGLMVDVPNRYDDTAECERISKIVVTGLHLGTIDLSAGTTDTNFIDLLVQMSHSNIFNTLPDSSRYGFDMTSLETVYSTAVTKSGIYNEKQSKAATFMVTNEESSIVTRGQLWEDELEHVRDVINALSAIDLDIDSFDMTSLFDGSSNDEVVRQSLEDLLNRLSDSSTLHSVVPFKLRSTIDSYKSSLSASQVSFENANYDYNGKVTYAFKDASLGSESLSNAYGYDENKTLSYIIMESSNLQSVDMSDLTSIDRAPFISVLKKLSSSHVFNTLEEGLVHSPSVLTAFENTYVSVIDEGNVYQNYGSRELEVDRVATFEATRGVTSFDAIKTLWDDELDAVDQVISDYQKCGFTFTTMNFSILFSSSLTEEQAESNRVDFENLMLDVNSTLTLHSAIQNTVNESIDKISGRIGGASFDNANVYYSGYTVVEQQLGNYYSETEIGTLSYIVKDIMRMPDIDTTDISSIDATKVTTVLAELAKSQIFNSIKTGEEYTSFDEAFATIMTAEGIDDLYYYPANPLDKDAAYTSSEEKAYAFAKATWVPLTPSTDIDLYDVSLIDADTGSLKYVLLYFVDPANSGVINALNGNTESLGGDVIYDALSRLNSCSITCDMVPNVIDKTISNPSFSFGSINIKRANPFYCYSDIWGYKYDDDEIESISSIITRNNNMKDSGGHSIFENLGSATVTHSTVADLKEMLNSLHDSKVFNLAGARTGASYFDASVASWKESWTVFEQVLGTIYDESNLASMAYNSTVDTSFASATDKLVYNMEHFKAGDLDSLHSSVANKYEIEIAALCESLDISIDLGMLSGGVGVSAFSLTLMTPEEVRDVSYAFNRMDIVSDVLPNKIDSFIVSTGIQKYNQIDVDGTKINTANYHVSQVDMRDGAIESIYKLSLAVYEPAEYDEFGNKTKDAKYLTFSGADSTNMEEFILIDGKFSTILGFIDEPHGFYATAKYNGVNKDATSLASITSTTGSYDFTARDVFFYNISTFKHSGESVNLGSYLGNGDSLLLDLIGSREAFDNVEKTSEAYLAEETAIHSTVTNLGTVYAAYEAASSVTTIPNHLAEFEALSNGTVSASVDSLFSYFVSNDVSISKRYAGGLLGDPINKANAYINGNEYYTTLFDMTSMPYPTSYYDGGDVRVRATYDAESILNGYTLFDDVDDGDVKNAYMSMLAITNEIGINATTSSHTVDSAKLSAAFATIDSLVSNPRVSALTKLFYLSSTYDYLLNRGAFHGEYLTTSEKDVPNPFDSSFTYSGLSSFIA